MHDQARISQDEYSNFLLWIFGWAVIGWIDPCQWIGWISTSLTCLQNRGEGANQSAGPKGELIWTEKENLLKKPYLKGQTRPLPRKVGLSVDHSPQHCNVHHDIIRRQQQHTGEIQQACMLDRPTVASTIILKPILKNLFEDRLARLIELKYGKAISKGEAKKWLFYTGPFLEWLFWIACSRTALLSNKSKQIEKGIFHQKRRAVTCP